MVKGDDQYQWISCIYLEFYATQLWFKYNHMTAASIIYYRKKT